MASLARPAARERNPRNGSAQPHDVRARSHVSAAAGLLGSANGLTLPSLIGTAPEFVVRDNEAVTPAIAKALLRHGLADPGRWNGDVHEFLDQAFQAWIDAHGGALIREVLYPVYAYLCDGPDRWGGYAEYNVDDTRPEVAWIVCGAGGQHVRAVNMADTLRTLEEAHPRFASTFYRAFLCAARRVIAVWDWYDAQDYEARMCEWEDEVNEVDRQPRNLVPDVLKRDPLADATAIRNARDARNHPIAAELVRSAVELHRLSHALKPDEAQFGDAWAFAPLPALLVRMEEHDLITGHFDAEMDDIANTGEPQPPSFVVELDPSSPRRLKKAVSDFTLACDVLAGLSKLIQMMPGAADPMPLADVLAGTDDDNDGVLILEDWE